MKHQIAILCAMFALSASARSFDDGSELKPVSLESKRPPVEKRLFVSDVIERRIQQVQKQLKDRPYLLWMFTNCFPNTLDTTVHYRLTEDGDDDTFIYTGDRKSVV